MTRYVLSNSEGGGNAAKNCLPNTNKQEDEEEAEGQRLESVVQYYDGCMSGLEELACQ